MLFVALAASVLAGLARWPLPLPRGAWRLAPYSIGTLAAFWTIQRVVDSVSSRA